jgi:hypothetical protein
MDKKRVYPRIDSDWPLYLKTDEGQKIIGQVNNISLSGALLHFNKDYELEKDKNLFILKLYNRHMEPPELILEGLKEWTKTENNEVSLALAIEKLQGDERTNFIRFLSRSEKLEVEAFLVENAD